MKRALTVQSLLSSAVLTVPGSLRPSGLQRSVRARHDFLEQGVGAQRVAREPGDLGRDAA